MLGLPTILRVPSTATLRHCSAPTSKWQSSSCTLPAGPASSTSTTIRSRPLTTLSSDRIWALVHGSIAVEASSLHTCVSGQLEQRVDPPLRHHHLGTQHGPHLISEARAESELQRPSSPATRRCPAYTTTRGVNLPPRLPQPTSVLSSRDRSTVGLISSYSVMIRFTSSIGDRPLAAD